MQQSQQLMSRNRVAPSPPPWKKKVSPLYDLAEREGLRDSPCGAVSQPETLHGVGQVTQVEHGEPLKCLREGGARMENGGGGGRRERCYRFHLLLRVGVKGVAENRWPTFALRKKRFQQRGLPGFRKKKKDESKVWKGTERDGEGERRRYRKTGTGTPPVWRGRQERNGGGWKFWR